MDFLRKYRHVLAGLLILLIALQIPIYWKQDRTLGLSARLLYMAAYYPQHAWTRMTDGVRSVLNRYVFLINVEAENEWLKSQNATLRGKLFEYRETDQENARIRSLLGMRDRNSYHAVGGRIIALDASTWFQSFTIDIGENDGIRRGMPVVTAEGLVGSVVSVAARSAKVLPIVDMNSSVDVVDSRSRAHGMLVGRGRERAYVNYLERSEDVKTGDLLVTSGLGGAFPPGLPVAIIREVRPKSYGLFQDAYVDTIIRFGRLENVLVLQYVEGEPIPVYQLPVLPSPLDATSPAGAVTAPTLAGGLAAEPSKVLPAAMLAAAVTAPAAPPPRKKRKKIPVPPPVDPAEAIGEAPPVNIEPALNFPAIPSAMPAGTPPAASPAVSPAAPPAASPAAPVAKPALVDPVPVPAEEKPPEPSVVPQPIAPAAEVKP